MERRSIVTYLIVGFLVCLVVLSGAFLVFSHITISCRLSPEEKREKKIDVLCRERVRIDALSLAGTDLDPSRELDGWKALVSQGIKHSLEHDFQGTYMQELCGYALEGGKHLRASMVLSIVDQFRPDLLIPALEAALSVEYIHAASLVLDDMMDMDTERRGKATLYVKYGFSVAQLTALQLISVAFVKLTRSLRMLKEAGVSEVDANRVGMAMFENVSHNIHLLGLGQYADILPSAAEEVNRGFELVVQPTKDHKPSRRYATEQLIHQKTGSLFEVSFLFGWWMSHPEEQQQDSYTDMVVSMARDFGLLFQIVDDLEDLEQDRMRSKMQEGTKSEGQVLSFPLLHGVRETATACATEIANRWHNNSNKTGLYNNRLISVLYNSMQHNVSSFCECHEQHSTQIE